MRDTEAGQYTIRARRVNPWTVPGRTAATADSKPASRTNTLPPKTFAFPINGSKRGLITTNIPVDPTKTYDVRLSMDIRTPDGTTLPSITVKRTLDPGDHAPKRPFTTTLGTLFVPIGERLKRLFRKR